eukprot:GEMP01003203.1.p1 GENE.GEMP01003203.1~~GEMP01003203.1.p1  ORF type:complete len:773 (+),score=115.20 GEMP01003203.1:90-2408(+)
MYARKGATGSGGGIRQFRSGEPMDEKEASRTWESLEQAIHQIHAHNASSLSFEELYRNAYNLVLHKYGELLYNGVQKVVTNHLKQVARSVTESADHRLLDELKAQWDDHKTTMVMIRDILMYMDRNFVNQYKKIPVYEMGLMIFREHVSGHPRVKDRLLTIMLSTISAERGGEHIDFLLLKHTVTMFVDLSVQGKNVYRECFEDPYLADARRFYQGESGQYIATNTCPDFLKKAAKRIREEKHRVESYLHESTLEKLQLLLDEEWILAHYKALIQMENSGCTHMFQHDKAADLERMYQLFSRCPLTLKEVQRVMIDCICAAGKEILNDPEKVKVPVAFISALLILKQKYDVFVKESFKENKEFQLALKQAFESFLNRDTRTAQYLSLYVDDLFRKGLKTMSSDGEIDQALEQVVTIFRYLQDKDVFENFYKQHLSRRLLRNPTMSDESEKSMISKLKSECGHQYTSKLEGMFQDMKLSEDLMKQYKVSPLGQRQGISLMTSVLTSGFWPSVNLPMCELPPEMREACQRFETFYLSKHTGRRLTWQPHQGNCDVKALMRQNSKHELNVSTYQACILVMFNSQDIIRYEHIAQSTKIPAEELKRQLLSLYCNSKCKILTKATSDGTPIDHKAADQKAPSTSTTARNDNKSLPSDGDFFMVNPGFESKLFRIKIPLVQVKDKPYDPTVMQLEGSSGDVPATVEEDRKHLVEAVIVRIMKSRKALEHNQLVVEVTKHLSVRFSPSPQLVKQRIEKLIEREYLERSNNDRRMYHYLA